MKSNITYYSTNLRHDGATFREALLKGLAPDGGLFMPAVFPQLSGKELDSYTFKNYPEIAFDVISRFTGNEIDANDLLAFCYDAYDFSIPLEKVCNRTYIMRLDNGPTASFKDFGARMMGRMVQHFLNTGKRRITILTATSGDTGSAVASAFYGLKNIRVIILFPVNEVSEMQRKQMTTLKGNIQVIAVNGNFDDCQMMVKKAFTDSSLKSIQLSSANSINIGRLLPQSVYYFWAWSRLSSETNKSIVFSIPSGNFGNLTGGLIAKRMGLPVRKFIASTNENDEVPSYLASGIYKMITPSRNCISTAMNVGHPSNMARIIALYGGVMDEQGRIIKEPDMERLRNDIFAVSVSEDETLAAIDECYRQHKLLLEPHGAVAWVGLKKFLDHDGGTNSQDQLLVSLETAHPSKFQEEIKQILKFIPETPPSLSRIDEISEEFVSIESDYEAFKNYLLKNYC
ncbi:MAG: threonine synthase [Bacteroidales bacterium]|nr:threonine synthase [Bacteroidales bacterium]